MCVRSSLLLLTVVYTRATFCLSHRPSRGVHFGRLLTCICLFIEKGRRQMVDSFLATTQWRETKEQKIQFPPVAFVTNGAL